MVDTSPAVRERVVRALRRCYGAGEKAGPECVIADDDGFVVVLCRREDGISVTAMYRPGSEAHRRFRESGDDLIPALRARTAELLGVEVSGLSLRALGGLWVHFAGGVPAWCGGGE